MAKMTFSKLCSSLDLKRDTNTIEIKLKDEVSLEVRKYLTVDEKTEMLQFIINGALDDRTGCFSPLRVEVYYGIAICKWYGGINFTDKQLADIAKTYDILESNSIIRTILDVIPGEEREFVRELINDTIQDISRYNSSAAGILQSMSGVSSSIDEQLSAIMEKVKNAEGLEILAPVKDVVGKD